MSTSSLARCAYRHMLIPYGFDYGSLGFRVMIAAPIQR